MAEKALTLLDVPKGVARLLQTMASLEAQNFDAAEFATLATMLGHHVGHVKASTYAARDLQLVTVNEGGGRGKKATVQLTAAGRALVIPLAPASGAGS